MLNWDETLADVSVIEIGHMVAGPAASLFLSDLGAEVIKIEGVNGDITRRLGPQLSPGYSAMYASVNGNKKSVVLDLRDEEAQEHARRLIADADVLVTNLDGGMLETWGLDYSVLSSRNPGLIYVDVSAFGAGGPPGTDTLAQADRGLMDLTGPVEGPGYRAGASVVDVATGLWAAFAVLGALRRRTSREGQGEHVSVNLADVCLSLQLHHLAMSSADPASVYRNGNHSTVSCTPVLPASDGRVCVVVLHDRHWRDLAGALGRPELVDDERFADDGARLANQSLLERVLANDTLVHSRSELVDLLRQHRLPCAEERTYSEVLDDPVLRERGVLYEVASEEEGRPLQVRPPLEVDGGWRPRSPAPTIGQHNAEILDLQ